MLADQRMGRCGRVAEGICVRLYSEENYQGRPRFTPPEILRTNLADVILRMISLKLGNIEAFPFIDRPEPRSIRDGLNLLTELEAIRRDESGSHRKGLERYRLTVKGRIMARMPILFTGDADMSITDNQSGSIVTYTVYIEDGNGNPPITGSTFVVTQIPLSGAPSVLLTVTYGDGYTHRGTWRDRTDSMTNIPYTITTTITAGDKVQFAFTTPECTAAAPGCSGSDQTTTYLY